MHPLTTAPATSFLLTLLLFLHLTTSFPSNGIRNLPNCNQTFSCGNLTNITYPFTGGQRPSHCGLPELRLACVNDSVTTLTAKSLAYRVTQLNQVTQTLRLSHLDFDDDSPCSYQFTNTTLDDRIFSFGSDHETLSLFYGCENVIYPGMASGPNPTNFNFSCDTEGDSKEGVFMIGNFSEKFDCQSTTQVPILTSQVDRLLAKGSLVLGEVLREGFDVSYSNPYSGDCDKCYKHSSRHCGFDAQLSKPICICNDQLCPEKSNNRKPLTIGLSVASAAVIGIFMGCWILVMMQRKKRKSALVKSKGLPSVTPPSSKGLATSTSFSRTTASLTSSKSTLDKGSTYFGVRLFSYNELEEATNSFDSSKELGDGGFGTVYHGVLRDGRVVAVKRLYENNMRPVDTNRHRHDINLSNMAVNKIQNHALNELVDPFLGFDKDFVVRKMVTSVAELGFRCLQQEREMRPTMEEVLEALKRIEQENYGAGRADVLDIKDDDVGLLKHAPPPLQLSPDSLTDQFWVNITATPTQSPTTSPVFHIRRRRKTLRMLLSKNSDLRRRIPRREDQSEVEEDPLPEKKVRRKLKDLFVSSPPFEEKERRSGERGGGEEVGLISGGGVALRRGSGSGGGALGPVAASFRYRLLRRAWRPVLFTIPE
ncbi:unnamed protein product [Dovyalis caffra]|uniref:non-specific serine/threonine protein kinase n=1 Tax=Dovyalis caffra TaxID=77055 RepID=A0AAV1S472_9ROSI|nr:unnamed protein product [Dovyalis caffra]